MNHPTKIITHHALSLKSHTVADVDNWHRRRWPGFVSETGFHVGYHYVIEWDGSLTQTRYHYEEGAHTLGQNSSSIGVCFMGNFDHHYPSREQIKTWQKVYAQIGGELPVYPHRKYATKSCHGKLLPDSYFAAMVGRKYMIRRIEQLRMQISRLKSLLLKKR